MQQGQAASVDPGSLATRSVALQRFYPALDGLRAVAFIMVFCFHYCRLVSEAQFWSWGWMGVDLFFAISGFLITGILYDSLNKSDYFRRFYLRRALRIFPIYYGFWLLILLLTPLLHVQWNRYLVMMAFYLGNLSVPRGMAGLHADPGVIIFTGVSAHLQRWFGSGLLINHFWSLCVEEQFYMVWPLTLFLLRGRKKILALCFALLAIVPFGRLLYMHTHPELTSFGGVYFPTWSRPDGLLLGAALAIVLRSSPVTMQQIRKIAAVVITVATVALILLVHLEPNLAPQPIFDTAVSGFGFTLIALVSTGILALTLDSTSRFASLLQAKWLTVIGRVSYGMYFYHEILYSFLAPKTPWFTKHHVGFVLPLVGFGVTFFVSVLSFRLYESKFLQLKERWSSRPGDIDDPPANLTGSPTHTIAM